MEHDTHLTPSNKQKMQFRIMHEQAVHYRESLALLYCTSIDSSKTEEIRNRAKKTMENISEKLKKIDAILSEFRATYVTDDIRQIRHFSLMQESENA